ncbi:MAG: SipW-dependent-type signal peptide-containing protein, partial [Clostridia bacterium]|nr:SipW-dependent-type signal peptide-containing protein [Clostridia bacterium]
MKNTKKILVLALAAVLLVAVSVGGTVAFLQDRTQEIVNTFTTSNIDITLEESKNLDLKMVPGK